jgi:hypothetical protein
MPGRASGREDGAMSTVINHQAGRAVGERRRDAALSDLMARRAWLIRGASRALLIHLLDHETGTAVDVADRLPIDPDGIDPRWRGAVQRTLSWARLILLIGQSRSCRPSRHAGTIGVWALAADLDTVRAWLDAHPEMPEPEPTATDTMPSSPPPRLRCSSDDVTEPHSPDATRQCLPTDWSLRNG